MQVLTHSTFVETLSKIQKERMLPTGGDVIARIRQDVTPMQVVARMPKKLDFIILPVSDLLGISANALQKYLLVEVGATVNQGTPLIGKRGLFGKEFSAPIDGIVYKISDGRIILQQKVDWVELRALIPGQVTNQIPNRGVVIETTGSRVQAVWSSSKEGYGKIKVVTQTAAESMNNSHLNEETSKHILVAGKITDLEVLKNAAKIKTQGLIVGSMPASLCQAANSLPFPVLITDGIGSQDMAEPIFRLFQKSRDREAALFGHMNEDWESRPEVILPLTGPPKNQSSGSHDSITIGKTVRILRQPFAGQVGKVARLYNYSQTTQIGTTYHGADVKLSDGRNIFVPFANLDVIIM